MSAFWRSFVGCSSPSSYLRPAVSRGSRSARLDGEPLATSRALGSDAVVVEERLQELDDVLRPFLLTGILVQDVQILADAAQLGALQSLQIRGDVVERLVGGGVVHDRLVRAVEED